MRIVVLLWSSVLAVVAGPMFETLLILFVSGIPMLDKAAEDKWGKSKAFREYRNKTAVLIPSLY
jgi:steroid 5-alpha reductase family enzyme